MVSSLPSMWCGLVVHDGRPDMAMHGDWQIVLKIIVSKDIINENKTKTYHVNHPWLLMLSSTHVVVLLTTHYVVLLLTCCVIVGSSTVVILTWQWHSQVLPSKNSRKNKQTGWSMLTHHVYYLIRMVISRDTICENPKKKNTIDQRHIIWRVVNNH